MKIAVIYKSLTGNTKIVAEAVKAALKETEVVYIGEPVENVEADVYFVGTWIDKGNCTKEISEFLNGLEGKKVALFATAGFGGSTEYYDTLAKRMKEQVSDSNQIVGTFLCQGKMPMSVRERYVAMMQANPEDKNMEVNIRNFDEALSHPDTADIEAVKNWASEMMQF